MLVTIKTLWIVSSYYDDGEAVTDTDHWVVRAATKEEAIAKVAAGCGERDCGESFTASQAKYVE